MNDGHPVEGAIPADLAHQFLATFAQLEYALKLSGFAIGNPKEVSANWDAFAKAIDEPLKQAASVEVGAAMEYLLKEPPRKQVLVDGRLDFIDAPPDSGAIKALQVLLMVRRVRNNLFHGAKMWSTGYANRARDLQLIKASLLVLNACIGLNDKVATAFGNALF